MKQSAKTVKNFSPQSKSNVRYKSKIAVYLTLDTLYNSTNQASTMCTNVTCIAMMMPSEFTHRHAS